MGKCKDCKWWGTDENQAPIETVCEYPRIWGSYSEAKKHKDVMVSYETIGTGPEFGCVHYEQKPFLSHVGMASGMGSPQST